MKFNRISSSFNSLGMYPVYWDRDRCDIMSTNCCSKATGFQITSQFVPRDRCYIMLTNCCSVESDKIPNQIAVWTEGSWRSSCSTPNWMQCTMTSCRELSMIEGSKIPNLISLDKLTDRSSCATPSGHADFCQIDLRLVSCIVTGNGVVQHLHDRTRAYRSHRKQFCSCLQETAARGFRPSHIDASAIEDVHRPVERQREGNEIISSLMSVLWSTSPFDTLNQQVVHL